MFDCIVVGAGPAGSSAAYHLAKRGRSVLVLEKEVLPRYKPCGGGVSPQVAQWIDADFSPVIAQKVDQIRFTWKLGDPVEAVIDTPEPMWMVRRDEFDHFLVKQAQGQGAEVKDGIAVIGVTFQDDRWEVQTSQGSWYSRYLIAADGGAGPLAQWLGFKKRKLRQALILELPGTLDAEAGRLSQFEFGLLKQGYLWNVPKRDSFTFCAATLVGGESRQLQEALATYVRFFNLDPATGRSHAATLHLWEGQQPLHTQNALLAGETAGVVDPFSAEGIRPSILSGMRSAEAIDAALGGDLSALPRYSEILHEQWGSDMVWAHRIAGIFYRVAGFGYQIGVKRPSARARMGKILCGEIRYSDVATRAIKLLSSKLIPGLGS
jgi:geranylgeranyl reductase family protein